MNKKLLFAAMSLAALTACNSDDFESKNVAQQETSPVVFEVLNNNDGFTRASMNGNKVAWSAEDGDLFTLFHGGTLNNIGTTPYQNATFKAEASDGKAATLTTPSMILPGSAVMVWPVDTTFRVAANVPSLVIPEVLPADVENYIPYVSDEINIGGYVQKDDNVPATYTNKAGYNRVYPIYMRPMASQLNLKAEYVGLDALEALYDGSKLLPDDGLGGIDPIEVTSVELVADEGKTPLTKEIPLMFSDPDGFTAPTDDVIEGQWDDAVANNAWSFVTDFNKAGIVEGEGAGKGQVEKLTTKCVKNLDESKFLILPLKADLTGAEKSGIVVNTSYGKVIVASQTGGFTNAQYTDAEIGDAWYRYVSEAKAETADENASTAGTGDFAGKFKVVAKGVNKGLKQTLNGFSAYKATSGIVKYEPVGASATRYVKVLLKYLQIDGTHIKTNKQLRDIALIWKQLGTGATTTVYLDGDKDGKFEITQKTIELINKLNAEATGGRKFVVKPCDVDLCEKIVVTGGGDIQNMAFITFNDVNHNDAFDLGTDVKADVVFKAGETWNWKGTVTLATAATTGVKSFVNEGTLVNAATATLKILDTTTPNPDPVGITFVNKGTWTIGDGTNNVDVNVQFNVTNLGTVEIKNKAEYHQDGAGNDFTNDAETKPGRFLANPDDEVIGLVNNHGFFGGVNGGHINNYGLIEHLEESAKTYIYANNDGGAGFGATFAADNRIGRINLPYSNRNEENVSISNGAATGFVSVTVSKDIPNSYPSDGKLDLSGLGDYVNYCIIKSGVTEIKQVAAKIEYVEFDAGTTEIMWNVAAGTYEGLVVFSPVNIKRNCTIKVKKSIYLNAKMYVGGKTVDNGENPVTNAICDGYFGDTKANFAKMYLTY